MGARQVIDLVCQGKRVGVTANSHAVICNLLDETNKLAGEDQRRRERHRLLLQRAARLLHRLPGHERPLLSAPLIAALVAASVVAGWSTLFSP